MSDRRELLDLDLPSSEFNLPNVGILVVYSDCKWYGKDVTVTEVHPDGKPLGDKAAVYYGQIAAYRSGLTCAVVFPRISTSGGHQTFRVSLSDVEEVKSHLVTVFTAAVTHCILTEKS